MLKHRIAWLDSLRGLAILLVIGYHVFDHWSAILPYGDAYADIRIFNIGWLGVQLFFIISGYVIFLSLDNSKSIREFLVRRWLRLFPAMLIASIFIFATASLFSNRPFGDPKLIDLLPGLSFIDARWWSILLKEQINPLEGSFWSLYVEVKFYVFSALIYFLFSRKILFFALISAFTLAIVALLGAEFTEHKIFRIALKVANGLSFEHFGWFAAGAAYYIYADTKERRWLYIGIACAAVSSLRVFEFSHWLAIYPFGLSLIFVVAMHSQMLQKLLQNRLLMFFGFISYPLYLLHENMMISMIIDLAKLFPNLPAILYPIAPLCFVSLLAYLVSKHLENRTKKAIQSGMGKLKDLART